MSESTTNQINPRPERMDSIALDSTSDLTGGGSTYRSSIELFRPFSQQHGLLGIDPDFSLIDSSSSHQLNLNNVTEATAATEGFDWCLEYYIFVHNTIRTLLLDWYRALRGLDVLATRNEVSPNELEILFKWYDYFHDFAMEYFDFVNIVHEPLMSQRMKVEDAAVTTGRLSSEEKTSLIAAFDYVAEERDNLIQSLTAFYSRRRSVGILKTKALVADIVKHAMIIIVHFLAYMKQEEVGSGVPILRHYFGPWEYEQLVELKRVFYERLPKRNAYVKMVAMCLSWQNAEEQRRNRALYLSSMKLKVLAALYSSSYSIIRSKLSSLANASELPRRRAASDRNSRTMSVGTDRTMSKGGSLPEGGSFKVTGLRRRSLDIELENIIQSQTRMQVEELHSELSGLSLDQSTSKVLSSTPGASVSTVSLQESRDSSQVGAGQNPPGVSVQPPVAPPPGNGLTPGKVAGLAPLHAALSGSKPDASDKQTSRSDIPDIEFISVDEKYVDT